MGSLAHEGVLHLGALLHGHARVLRPYNPEDAFAIELLRTALGSLSSSKAKRLSTDPLVGEAGAAEQYVDHLNLGKFVLLLSTAQLCIVNTYGQLQLHEQLSSIACCEVREDGVRLHLFDPVAVGDSARRAATAAGGGAKGRRGQGVPPSAGAGGDTTLIRFIKCSKPPLRKAMFDKIQHALSLASSADGV